VDRAQIEAKQSPFWQSRGAGRVSLPLPSGATVSIVIDDSEMLGANRFTSRGHVEGQPESRAVYAYNEGFLTASIETADHAYALRPATGDAAQVYEVDPALVPPCGGTRAPQLEPGVLASLVRQKLLQTDLSGATTSPGATVAAASGSDGRTIDLLMLYTQAVKTTLSGAARTAALQSEFDAAVARVNSDLSASQVSARIRLVGVAETRYDADSVLTAGSGYQNDTLTALYKTDDGKMDEIHALRDRYGADVVFLAHNRSDTVSAGLSCVLVNPSSKDPTLSAANADFAFGVVQYAYVSVTNVVSHELGHIFGCAHARGDDDYTTGASGESAFSYSYGYRFYGSNGTRYRDLMAYNPGTQLRYFSNPNITFPAPISAAIGVPHGQSGESDCAGTIEQTAFEIAAYRLAMPPATAGVMVNVSTRAFVGKDDAVLIGGFFVAGAGQKRILVRAAGPSLVGYGVTDALSNPSVEVYETTSNGNVLRGNNDDWGQPDGSQVLSAGRQVGAFDFATGSKDSGLVLNLPQGLYSAVVLGVGGTQGSSLVEVWDVDRTGNKVVNLSTRGYADVGKEMYAGFVVEGAPGTTKRILIRVLGPTLGRSYGVRGAMEDPLLELHLQATGELLIKNDDWAQATVDGNAFNPKVKSYSETQIAATPYAPPNRREPCLLLDLPPGNYSAVVQPFQALDRTPPEPAQPGVAIVEVYEITP
jgi:hypothetical protein